MSPRPKVKNCGTCDILGSLFIALADMYRRFPEWWDHEPYEAQSALWSLGYTDDLVPEEDIEAAMKVVLTDRKDGLVINRWKANTKYHPSKHDLKQAVVTSGLYPRRKTPTDAAR